MAARLRERGPALAIASAACGVMAWLGLYGFAWTDYDFEAAPAYAALAHGHLTSFLEQLPAYGGSLELRAPFALLPGLWGGGELAVYRLVALPCLAAAALLGVWLVGRMRAQGHSRLARAVALGLCVANPITLRALEIGHPEELLGGVLCVAAVLMANRGRPIWAGVLLGLAIANKQWAVLAVGPVLLTVPSTGWRRRAGVRVVLVAGVIAAAFLLPPLIVHPPRQSPSGLAVATQTGAIFQPEQVFWFAGDTGHVVRGLLGHVKPGYRTPPPWLAGLAHPLIIGVALPLTLLALRRRRPDRLLADSLLLLALLFLLRCALDPWDNVYYPLPFVLALLAWEATTRREPPVFSLFATAAVWTIFVWMPAHVSADVTAGVSIALFLAAAGALAGALYGRRTPARRTAATLSRRPPVPLGTG